MTNTKLLTSIYDYLGTISNIPKLLYPNIEYSSLPDEYIRVFVMNATPDDIGVKNISMKSGIIQCNVTIKESIGEIKASEIADLIIASFPRNTVIPTSKIRIDKTPYASQGINDGSGWYIMPVTIEYNKLVV